MLASNDTSKRLCKKCGIEYSETEEFFRVNPSGRFRSVCRCCDLENAKQYYYNNREKVLAQKKQARLADPEKYKEIDRQRLLNNPEKERARWAKYRAENPEKRIEAMRNWRDKNTERVKEYSYIYYHTHQEEQKARARKAYRDNHEYYIHLSVIAGMKRRSKLRNLPVHFGIADRRRALNYFHGCCAVCGRPLKDLFGTHTAAMDHWIPLDADDCPGTIPTNLLPLCHGINGCNNRKKNKRPEDFLRENFTPAQSRAILKRIAAYFAFVAQEVF